MGIIVQKFGGSSVANTKELYNVCKHITKEYNKKKRYDVLFEMKESKENENKVDFTPIYVTCGIISLVTISGFVYSTIRINKLSNDIKELSKKNKVKKGKSK